MKTPSIDVSPTVSVAVRGSNSRLLQAAALFATSLATTAVLMSAGSTAPPEIGAVLGAMKSRGDAASQQLADTPQLATLPAANSSERPSRSVPSSLDSERLAVLSRPVPADTSAAAEMARAIPLPKAVSMAPLTAEQTKVLAYGQFAPIAARVFSNATRQMETHWTLHPWDVARLADQASAEFFKERRIHVQPRLIAGAYYAESSGVVQVGFDQRGVDLINRGKSVEQVVQSGSKASFGLFQIDVQHEGAADLDPLRAAKRAASFLAEGQANLKRYPQLGMVAISATYNASTRLRTKIFESAPMDDAEYDAYARVRSHAASLSYGAAIYDIARRTYQAHLAEALKEGLPISVAAGTVQRVDPLQDKRLGAIQTLTGRSEIAAVVGAPSAPAAAPTPAPAPAQAPTLLTIAARAQDSAVTDATATPAAKVTPQPVDSKAQPAAAAVVPRAVPNTVSNALAAASHRAQGARADNVRTDGRSRGRATVASSELDAAIRGSARFQRPGYDGVASPRQVRVEPGVVLERGDRLPSAGRVQSGFQASVNEWKSGATSVLSRVAAFHEQRTRDMAVQQRESP